MITNSNCLGSPNKSLFSSSNLATSAPAIESAISCIVDFNLFSIFATEPSLDSSKSCSDSLEAVSKKSIWLSIKAPGKKNSPPTMQKFAPSYTAFTVWTIGSFEAVGITRKTLPAKVDPEIVEWLDFLVHAVHPLKQTRSSLIAMFLTELQERFAAGDLTGMPKVLQGALGASSYTEIGNSPAAVLSLSPGDGDVTAREGSACQELPNSMGTEPRKADGERAGQDAGGSASRCNRARAPKKLAISQIDASPEMETVSLPPQSIHPSSKKRLA